MRDRHLQALAAVVVLGAALRFSTLDVQSYWLDEAVTVRLLDQGLGGLVSDIPDSESTPPAYYVLAWLWSKLFGLGEVGLRSLSALLGTLTIVVAYLAARDLVSRRAGLVAAALVAANPLLVWYSQEARAYALLVLLTAVSLPLLHRRALAAWAAVAALSLATHYFALFVVVPQAVWLLARHRERRTLAAVALPALVGAALLPLAVDQAGNQGAHFIEGRSLAFRTAQVPKQMLVGFDVPAEALLGAVSGLIAAVAAAMLLLRADRDERRGGLAAAALGAAAVGLPFVVAVGGADYLITRNVIAGLVPLLIAAGAGLGARRAGPAGTAAAALLCAISVFAVVRVATEPRFQRDDWRGAAEALGPALHPRIIVATPAEGRPPLAVYLPGVREVPQPSVPVRELAGIGLARRLPGQERVPPRPANPMVPPGFGVVERTEGETFTVVLWRSPQPVELTAPAAETAKLVHDGAVVLYQPPAR